MEKKEDRYSALHQKIQNEHKDFKEGRIHAYELEGQVVKNLQLLKSLIQSEKVKGDLFETKEALKKTDTSIVEKLRSRVVDELSAYHEKDLAKFAIPKKYSDECFELLVAAWRQKINRMYAQTLTFTHLSFSKQSYRAFIIALSLNVSLKALKLEECGLKEYEMKLLAVLIKIHPTLTFLHLDKNPIKNEGLTPILAGLKKNDCLLYLSLIQTSLTDKGAKQIAESLVIRPLKSLHLEKNAFGEDALKTLIHAAEKAECELTYDEAEKS